jgi:hypothetical protein
VFKKLRCLVASLSPQTLGFNPRTGYAGFVVDKVAMGEVLFEYFRFPLSES